MYYMKGIIGNVCMFAAVWLTRLLDYEVDPAWSRCLRLTTTDIRLNFKAT